MIDMPTKSPRLLLTEFIQATLERGVIAARAWLHRTRTKEDSFQCSRDGLLHGFRAASLLLDAAKLDRVAAKRNQPTLIQPEAAHGLERMLTEFAQATRELRLEGDGNVVRLYERLVQRMQHRMPAPAAPTDKPTPTVPTSEPPKITEPKLPNGPGLDRSYSSVARLNGELDSAMHEAAIRDLARQEAAPPAAQPAKPQAAQPAAPAPLTRRSKLLGMPLSELRHLIETSGDFTVRLQAWLQGPRDGPPPQLDAKARARLKELKSD